ncbi:acyltransferase family protein [Bosea sp. PAMC 26642]|uniref:acyltransferase family protein n=1 Tax=Bosea sp. (strain PAMC 26642) TaxID=1792307 RepID=UPI000A9D11C0|nr:acyltransferase [Bosea sp. PAMC 26642]
MFQLHGIQALRAIAAFMVAVHHVQYDATALAQRAGTTFSPSTVLPWMAGVDIFFVVSGFIMVHASAGLSGKPGGARLFMERRLARIVPLYWAATTLFLLIGLILPGALNSSVPNGGQVAASYLFWPSVSTVGLVQPVYSLGWTLNYEMLFYALFAAGLALPAGWSLPAIGAALAILVGAEALAGPLPLPFGFWGQPIVLEFAIGMGLALLWRGGLRLRQPLRLAVATGGAALLVAGQYAPWSGVWSSFALHGSAAALLVLAAASGEARFEPSLLMRVLGSVGDASYALYLVHPFVIRGLREVFVHSGFGSPVVFIALALAGSVMAALAVHHGFERPATRWIRQKLDA